MLRFRSAFENVALLAKEPQNVEDTRYFLKLSIEMEMIPIVCKRGIKFAKIAIFVTFRSAFENVALLAKEPQNGEDMRYFLKLSLEMEMNPIVCKRRIKFAKMEIFVAFPISIRKCCIISKRAPKRGR